MEGLKGKKVKATVTLKKKRTEENESVAEQQEEVEKVEKKVEKKVQKKRKLEEEETPSAPVAKSKKQKVSIETKAPAPVQESTEADEDESEKKKRKRKKKGGKNKGGKNNKPADQDPGKVKEAALEYLHQWRDDKEAWKFQKVRQTWLLKNMFNDSMVADKDFKVLLKYLQGLEGSRRETLLKEMKEVVEQGEPEKGSQEEEEQADGSAPINKKLRYKRAMDIARVLA
eukprot:GILI01024076.1.p1 GENE.GILI01024076.1~~GILI01024076.1.p1  ORF type:complete len:228 (-),score=90.08 GILI01024076.1:320-1003(-)